MCHGKCTDFITSARRLSLIHICMDLVLLVIAADEGIMPQTREHMDILSLLGIEKSIIVLNLSLIHIW